MKEFSTSWKGSKDPSKQRKYSLNAPNHLKRKQVSSHLSKDLRTQYNRRSMQVKAGDSVKILRGQFRKLSGKVNRVDLKKVRVFVEGIGLTKKDGSKVPYPLHPSNLMIQTLDISDKKRKAIVERNKK
ncbi:MAG: 50S ribosomal protein L24 [Candidatus Nanoarchaeia archaeon]|nr:50S ribosomal protein L24 [Candidatus Nanoarchaeia archaeon]